MKNQAHSYQYHCRCKSVDVDLRPSQPIQEFQLRVCNCDYCMDKNISYLSDPNGSVKITSKQPLIKEYQGSEQAQFNLCSKCHDMIFVSYHFPEGTKGALNGALIPEAKACNKLSVSPKKLTAEEKIERWQQVWMPIIANN